MANPEHLTILEQGVEAWNQWRKENRDIKPDLSKSYPYKITLKKANLTYTNLSGANLTHTNLSEANLSYANLSEANLRETNLIGANLSYANLIKANLSETNLSYTNLIKADLSGANLSLANLIKANLIKADLSEANLSFANLSNSNLKGTQALNTNFKNATLTGTCTENLNTNTNTNFKKIECHFIYLRLGLNKQEKKYIFTERRPYQRDKIFEPGDFEKLVRKSQETIDLIFRNGINWQAFLNSYEQLKVEAGGDFFPVQSVEKYNDGSFIVKLNSPLETDKEAIDKFFEDKYQQELKLIEAKYKNELNAKDEQIEIYKQQNTNFIEIFKLVASKPVNVETNAMANNNQETFHNHQQGAKINNNANIVKNNATQQTNINSTPENSISNILGNAQNLLFSWQVIAIVISSILALSAWLHQTYFDNSEQEQPKQVQPEQQL